ncbi:hypothetical protein PVAND_017258 [Polypedilum vanderplanki]|uniref:Uncharacterized protein n=1 Tax=Polypedilum vanderplanki TaxID=319348 RepID=A0A9J6BIJ6_POLVA|nr:hypothetical protein PVAND_017258 [Polypedilum vanderplanki]
MNFGHFYKFFLILIFIFRNFTAVEVKIWDKNFTPDKFEVDVKNGNLTKYYFDFFQKIGLKENYKQIGRISQAIADVIDEFFIRQQIHFGVLIRKPLTLEYEEIIDKILSKDKEIQSITIYNSRANKSKNCLTLYSEFFFKEYSQSNIRLRFDPRKLKVLKILLKCNELKKIKEIEKLKQDLLQKHIVDLYSYYICQRNETTVEIITYEWFDADSCNQQKIKILNSFDIKTQKWQKPLKNYEKFKRFNGCQIRTIEDPYVHENKEKKYLSEYGEFMHIVAEKANFTLKIINISNDEIDLYIFLDIQHK